VADPVDAMGAAIAARGLCGAQRPGAIVAARADDIGAIAGLPPAAARPAAGAA